MPSELSRPNAGSSAPLKKRTRIVVVDDSPLIRELISESLAEQADFEVVGVAVDGHEALRLLEELQPDLLTLDLQMPRLSGLETLDRILDLRPTPVIVVSSLAQRSAEATLQALDRGAMDYVAKPEGLAQARKTFSEELPQKIRNMAGTDVRRVLQCRKARQARVVQARQQPRAPDLAAASLLADGCIAIGISTGGPPALSSLFAALTLPLPPIVVVQHMPQMFTGAFARRLDSLSALEVKEAETGDVLRPNLALIAPGGRHLRLVRRGEQVQALVADGDPVSGHKPSVDVLMQSAASTFGPRCLGLIMTGMGRDGADGCKAIRAAGGFTLGQDEATSDVYGMNKVAFIEGHIDQQVPLDKLPEMLSAQARRRCTRKSRTPATAIRATRALRTIDPI
jgi:two-component system chemotaxis response regulator CheB